MNLRRIFRLAGFGRAAYLLWHAPLGAVRRSAAAGGPAQQWLDARGRHAMARAAATLPTARNPAAVHLPELHFLTGRRFWYQTAFCLHSLQLQAKLVFRAVFHDDGSLDKETAGWLLALFPAAEVRFRADNDARLAALLPPARFPAIHAERRRPYPNFLKLTDPHAGAHGWRLVLDSDMLFFRRPEFLLAGLAAANRPMCMTDLTDAYGYPLPLLARLAGAPVPSRVNAGFAGMQSDALDWDRVEFWCRRLTEASGPSYYLEQAIFALLLAGHEYAAAPSGDYRLAPDETECRAPQAVLHHYVAGSKRDYFRHMWRRIATTGPA